VTPFIFSTRYPNIRGFIKKNGINRLVLKTESPYINYKENKIPNPYVINFIAEKISKLLNIPIEQIFSATFSNTQKVYGKRN
jgi:Tat protein secretion system quality control protein TatD with DNase activity